MRANECLRLIMKGSIIFPELHKKTGFAESRTIGHRRVGPCPKTRLFITIIWNFLKKWHHIDFPSKISDYSCLPFRRGKWPLLSSFREDLTGLVERGGILPPPPHNQHGICIKGKAINHAGQIIDTFNSFLPTVMLFIEQNKQIYECFSLQILYIMSRQVKEHKKNPI